MERSNGTVWSIVASPDAPGANNGALQAPTELLH